MKKLKIAFLVLGGVFLAIQFFGPVKTNPTTDPAQSAYHTLEMPPAVTAALQRSCNDCHSNDTRWPWYTSVAPVSWWTIDHVNHGRSHLNFSEWGKLSTENAMHTLTDICEEIESGAMPLPSYLRMHGGARLSLEDRKNICLWTVAQRNKLSGKSDAGHGEHR